MLMTVSVLGLGPALGIVNEWKPQDFSHIAAFEIVLLGGFGFALYRGIKLPPLRLVLVLGLTHMALTHVRNSELVALLVPMIIARPLDAQLGRYASKNCEADVGVLPFDPRLLLAAALILLVPIAGLSLQRADLAPAKIDSPKSAVDAIEAAHLSRIFNDYDFGGYLIFSGVKVFVDGRIDHQPAVYAEYFAAGTEPTSYCDLHSSHGLVGVLASIFRSEPPPPPHAVDKQPAAPPVVENAPPAAAPAEEEPPKPKRGFWSRLFGKK